MSFNVTDILLRYCKATKQVYNGFLQPLPFRDDGDDWLDIELALFRAMVINPILGPAAGMRGFLFRDELLASIRVGIVVEPEGTPLYYCYPRKGNYYPWETRTLYGNCFEGHFLRFFDWTIDEQMNNEFVRGRITWSQSEEFDAGGEFLVATDHVKFWTDDEPYYLRFREDGR